MPRCGAGLHAKHLPPRRRPSHPCPPPQIGTWTPKGSGTRTVGAGGPTVSYRRAWGISVRREDDAYLWARWLAPVYSVTVANVKTALRLQVRWGSRAAQVAAPGGAVQGA